MSVCCECCVLSGRGLCDELITRPGESYRIWCVIVCDLETSRMLSPWSALGRSAQKKKKLPEIKKQFTVNTKPFKRLTFIQSEVLQPEGRSRFFASQNTSVPEQITKIVKGQFLKQDTAPPGGQSLLNVEASRSRSDETHSVGLLWTSDRSDAETSTWQHTSLRRDRHPCPRRDWNPQSQQASIRRPTP